MSEVTPGSGEAPAPQAAPVPGVAGTLGVTPAVEPAPAPIPAIEPALVAPAGADAWMAKFEGENLGWLQNRGLTGKNADEAIANLVDGQRNAEKRLGVPSDRLLTLPADATSEGAMDPVWDALGRPKNAAGYEIDPGDSELTKALADTMSAKFHAVGLSKAQGEAVVSSMEEFFGAEFDRTEEQTQTSRAANLTKLKQEWGEPNFDLNIRLAQEAVAALGVTAAEIETLSAAFSSETGDADVIRMFNRLGQKRGGETPFINGEGAPLGLGATTPEAALARIAEMKAEPGFAAVLKANNPNNATLKQYRALRAVATKGT